MNSRLSGHTDHSEQSLDSPLFSFSFGQTAIFLLGDITVDVKPAAMFLSSGDIVVMSKDSRLSYHGVPKIIKSYSAPWCNEIPYNDDDKCEAFDTAIISCEENCWIPFEMYININRININVRQVLKTNQGRIAS
uniref:Alpha-ketoglutarate-dependent dioxygenase AlkB-like domain-containing protein n=1 Tax=Photinus pyralis TaxID=7054 RepID=A0A1Y1JVR6_PHOPY